MAGVARTDRQGHLSTRLTVGGAPSRGQRAFSNGFTLAPLLQSVRLPELNATCVWRAYVESTVGSMRLPVPELFPAKGGLKLDQRQGRSSRTSTARWSSRPTTRGHHDDRRQWLCQSLLLDLVHPSLGTLPRWDASRARSNPDDAFDRRLIQPDTGDLADDPRAHERQRSGSPSDPTPWTARAWHGDPLSDFGSGCSLPPTTQWSAPVAPGILPTSAGQSAMPFST